MTDIIIRILTGALSAILLVVGLQYMMDPAATAGQFGLAVTDDIGLATLRADIGGFFCASGGLGLAAAIRHQPSWLLGPITLIILAFVGRLITLAVDGAAPGAFTPMIIEAVTIIVFGYAMMRGRTA